MKIKLTWSKTWSLIQILRCEKTWGFIPGSLFSEKSFLFQNQRSLHLSQFLLPPAEPVAAVQQRLPSNQFSLLILKYISSLTAGKDDQTLVRCFPSCSIFYLKNVLRPFISNITLCGQARRSECLSLSFSDTEHIGKAKVCRAVKTLAADFHCGHKPLITNIFIPYIIKCALTQAAALSHVSSLSFAAEDMF